MGSFAKYRLFKYFAPLLVCSYAIVTEVTTTLHHGELFPFFNWGLFSASSGLMTDYEIRVSAINGHALPSPRLYYNLTDIFAHARQKDVNFKKTVEQMSAAVRIGDKQTVSELRKLLEQRYMAEAVTVKYDLVRLTYDPIHRLRSGEIKDTVVLASYSKKSQ